MRGLSIISCLFFFWTVGAYAASTEENKIEVPEFTISLDPALGTPDDFNTSNAKVVPLQRKQAHIPTRQERDVAFSKVAGLGPLVADWDALDKDLLFIRAKSLSLDDLAREYPKFPRSLLVSLQKELKAGSP